MLPGNPTSDVPARLVGEGHHDAGHGDPVVGTEVRVSGDGGEDEVPAGRLGPVVDRDGTLKVGGLTDEAVLVGDDDAVQLAVVQVSEESLESGPDDVVLVGREVVVLV